MPELRAIEDLSNDELRVVQADPSTSEARASEAWTELQRREGLIPAKRPPLPRTIVAGVDVPFLDLVVLYIKLMFAAIPAALIGWLIYWVASSIAADIARG